MMFETHQLNGRQLKVTQILDFIIYMKIPGLQVFIDFAINNCQVRYSSSKQTQQHLRRKIW